MTTYTTEQFASWKDRSDEYVGLGIDEAQRRRTRIDASFEAAYFGFLATLARRDRLQKTEDHPNIRLVSAACIELKLSGRDRELAAKLTHAYYTDERDKFDPENVLALARRVRSAVWGVPGGTEVANGGD